MVKSLRLDHKGGFYLYRVHDLKLKKINDFAQLKDYLFSIFEYCPTHYFNSGPRSSALKFDMPINLVVVKNHEISALVKHGLERNGSNRHLKVQTFMLGQDNNTIATEVPIWLLPQELQNFEGIFNSKEPLTGHIDILWIENGKVYILDYKPNADKEIYAATQVFFYALMLSKRTGLALDNFICGYFDENTVYLFKPEEKALLLQQKLVT